MSNKDTLPPLPTHSAELSQRCGHPVFTGRHMQAYARTALALHESDRALTALTAEQSRLGMYDEAEKQEPDRLDAERLDYLQRGSTVEMITHSRDENGRLVLAFRIGGLWDAVDPDIRKAIDAAKEAKP